VCQELLDEVRNNWKFLSRVVTGNETWVNWYGKETKQKSFWWKLVLSMSEEGKAFQVKYQEHIDGLFLTLRSLFIRDLFLQVK
jgi:hypothetical protein